MKLLSGGIISAALAFSQPSEVVKPITQAATPPVKKDLTKSLAFTHSIESPYIGIVFFECKQTINWIIGAL